MAIKGTVITGATVKSALTRLASLTKHNRDVCCSIDCVAEEFNVSALTIRNWQKRFETTGSYEPAKRGRKPEAKPQAPASKPASKPVSSAGFFPADCLDDVLGSK